MPLKKKMAFTSASDLNRWGTAATASTGVRNYRAIRRRADHRSQETLDKVVRCTPQCNKPILTSTFSPSGSDPTPEPTPEPDPKAEIISNTDVLPAGLTASSGKLIHNYTGPLAYVITFDVITCEITRTNTEELNNYYTAIGIPPYEANPRGPCVYQGGVTQGSSSLNTGSPCGAEYHSFWVSLWIGEYDAALNAVTPLTRIAFDDTVTKTWSGFTSGKTYLICCASSYHCPFAPLNYLGGGTVKMPGWEPFACSNILIVKIL